MNKQVNNNARDEKLIPHLPLIQRMKNMAEKFKKQFAIKPAEEKKDE